MAKFRLLYCYNFDIEQYIAILIMKNPSCYENPLGFFMKPSCKVSHET